MLSAGDQASFGHTFSITRLTVIPTFLSRAYVPRYACTRLRVSSKLAFSIPRPLIFIPLNSRPFDSCRSVAPVSRAFSSLPPLSSAPPSSRDGTTSRRILQGYSIRRDLSKIVIYTQLSRLTREARIDFCSDEREKEVGILRADRISIRTESSKC